MEFRDYYATLGVSKTATEKEIKQAYRKLARKYHPDVNPGDKSAESRFKEINEAYEVLGDQQKRRKYDELGANWRQYEQAEGAGWPFGAEAGGPTGGYRTMTPEEMEELFGDANPFSDFFNTFFGGARASAGERRSRRRAGRARPGQDVEHELPLTLEESYHGAMRRLSVKQPDHTRTVDVRIPAGVKDGARLRVAGEGQPGAGGAPAGDLYLRIRLQSHERFERKGQDLYTKLPVPVTTAVLGGEAEVESLAGKPVRLRIAPNTQNGQVLRVRGQGMPTVGRADQRGDLYVTVDVQVPRELTPEERTHWEALAGLVRDKSAQAV
jgi:curved DNA-binding protein